MDEPSIDPPLFEIVLTSAGAVSIRNNVVNETMHNPVGPWAEANGLYIEPSRLADRIQSACERDTELVVFDVGLGAAANALAILHCTRLFPEARVQIVSFERDLDLLRFALEHAHHFEHFRGFEPAMHEILERGSWTDGRVSWELRHGDFVELIGRETYRPHLVYFDPYSPRMNREMWSTACFRKIRSVSREACDGGTWLCTYSQATPIRTALLAAGFFVGYGVSTGDKQETTQAATVLADLERPLDARWFARWSRSDTPWPLECEPEHEAGIRLLIESHPQFAELESKPLHPFDEGADRAAIR